MHITTAVAASAFALTGASAMLAAPAQTQQPGQMTQAHVWVENRGPGEAVPVDLRAANLDHPIRVQVINGEPQFPTINPVSVRPVPVRQLWEYQTVTLASGEDMAQRLNLLGASGWETTGIASVGVQGTTLLVKRPRQP